jgi:dTDP-4-dehydrorhamnose 3,5-epimerase
MEEINGVDFLKTSIENLLSKPLKTIPDHRGEFVKISINNQFAEEDMSISYNNVLRGIHYVTEDYRMFTPIYGRLYLVFLDLQEGSSTKYDWFSLTVDQSNRQTFLIPPYVGCGHLILSPIGIVHYKLENKYDESFQRTIRFDDDRFNIYWPGDHSKFILSERDYYVDEKLIR